MSTAFVWNKTDSEVSDFSSSKNNNITIPQQIQSLDGLDILNISSGANHTLVCLRDGSVRKCDNKSILTKLDCVKGLPAQNVIQVAAGSSHSVVLTETHKVYTWGNNDKGQLGRGGDVNRNSRRQPKSVKSLAEQCVLQIACGIDHTLALTDDGRVFAWGSNSYGQLGLKNTDSLQILPKEVSYLRGIPVLQLAAGGNHSFIISKSGTLCGWGRNEFGQLGLFDTKNYFQPTKCKFICDKKIKYVCCGENHTAFLTMDGCVFTFGAGSNFQLGHCNNKNESFPKQVAELSGCEVSQIACGSNHTLAYVPKSGRFYVFGNGESGQFGLSIIENKNSPITLSGPFVLSSELHLTYFSMQLVNQSPELRIKSIHSGGNLSIVTVVIADTCDADDLRKENPTTQTLTLSQDLINTLKSLSPQDTPSSEFLSEIGKIFSSPSSLNDFFLLPDEEQWGTSSKKRGVNMDAVQTFFQDLKKIPSLMKFIGTKIETNLIPILPTSPPDVEALHLYLIISECHLFDQPEFYSSVLCQFAERFLYLYSLTWKMVDSWWPSIPSSSIMRLVKTYRQCVQYLLQLPCKKDSLEDVERKENLFTSMEMLQKLFQANKESNIIPDTTFVVPELKDRVNVEEDYPTVFQLYLSGETVEDLHFCNYPFLFDVETKSKILQTDSALQQLNAQRYYNFLDMWFLYLAAPQYPITNIIFLLSVNREDLVNDTIRKLRAMRIQEMKTPLGVKFEGENAAGEGVTKEFFSLFFRELMESKLKMFTIDDKSKLQWFDASSQQESEVFRIIGILCGLIIYNSAVVDLHFPLALYKKLLRKPVTLKDVKELMPVVGHEAQGMPNVINRMNNKGNPSSQLSIHESKQFRNLQELLDFDEDTFEDVFVFLPFVWKDTELLPGGAERMVNQSNKKEYVDLCVDYLLNKSVKTMFDAFNDGFHSICGGRILNCFFPEELQSLAEGNEDYDFFELEKNTEYNGPYNRKHPTIVYFWEVFHQLSLANKKKFLFFLTSTDRIPITGMKYIKIQIFATNADELLPIAFTCLKRLYLPQYATKEELETILLMVIQQTEGFSQSLN